LILLCGALAAFGCVGTETSQGATGSLSLDLVLVGGVEIDEVDWQITGNGMDMSSAIDVSARGSTGRPSLPLVFPCSLGELGEIA
jgi:hypothetical protein